MSGYTHKVIFNKTFRAGSLAGLTVEAEYPVCSEHQAKDDVGYLTAKTDKHVFAWGSAEWTVSNPHYVAL